MLSGSGEAESSTEEQGWSVAVNKLGSCWNKGCGPEDCSLAVSIAFFFWIPVDHES